MRKILIFIFLIISFTKLNAESNFKLETGDLLFQVNGRSSYTDAIRNVTNGIEGVEYTHVGVVYVDSSGVYVLEAIPFGVVKTPLKSFMHQSMKTDEGVMVSVGRLKKRYRGAIPGAIDKRMTLLGKRYDFLFDPNDDDYFCSELVEVSYLKKNGKPIFKANPMTFKDKKTGITSQLWINHFKMHKEPIPEGVYGTNPGDMSHSKSIEIIYNYF